MRGWLCWSERCCEVVVEPTSSQNTVTRPSSPDLGHFYFIQCASSIEQTSSTLNYHIQYTLTLILPRWTTLDSLIWSPAGRALSRRIQPYQHRSSCPLTWLKIRVHSRIYNPPCETDWPARLYATLYHNTSQVGSSWQYLSRPPSYRKPAYNRDWARARRHRESRRIYLGTKARNGTDGREQRWMLNISFCLNSYNRHKNIFPEGRNSTGLLRCV